MSSSQILIVDDDLTTLRVIEKFFNNTGCTLRCVTNGQEAIQALWQQPFQMIFMDCEMPILNGFAATQQIRAIEQANGGTRIPIIAMTATIDNEVMMKCQQCGMDNIIKKPIQKEDMFFMVKQYCAS